MDFNIEISKSKLVNEHLPLVHNFDKFKIKIIVSKQDIPGIKPRPQGWQTSSLTTELQ